ncbi:hypothetical protein LU699_11655 [Luteimonas fraxinea]|uniref:Uncharacterized protein n=1 Tax=Luteimonas fraxinea TaxID=2901869 RepID=A0ABS8UI41_9GAMM|nr:hypothetical protein [Luteimonas fraxinea]MCD9098647.1 hypothetical protein [Luteimonas fraxinea]UHH08953.1 hypothetical protein LU699_11655 [Luteimonas fraxinea]
MSIMVWAIVGGLVGFGALVFTANRAKSANNPWDERTFNAEGDVLARIDAWASANGYKLRSDDGRRRVYQKGVNFLTAPMRFEVDRDGDRYTTRSYVHVDALVMQGNLALTHPGVVAKVPRSNARKAQNLLFADLGQPLLP